MKILTIFISVLASAALSSCSKTMSDTSAKNSLNVFAAGSVDNGNATQAIYWKNSAPVLLPPTTQANITGNSYGLSMAVSGNDVYVAGFTSDGAGYWKNGNPTILASRFAVVHAIAVSGNDVYLAGQDLVNGRQCAVYWKNGDRIILTDTSVSGMDEDATSIFIAGNDVYVCGRSFVPSIVAMKATYWKNGFPVILGNDLLTSSANFITVSGEDIYVSGFQNSNTSPAVYWKNGVAVSVTDGNGQVGITAIGVSGNDVYITGSEYNAATHTSFALYWKNGQPTYLTAKNISSSVNCIAISGNDVYMGGSTSSSATSSNDMATYWANGVAVTLPYSANHGFQNVNAIVLTDK